MIYYTNHYKSKIVVIFLYIWEKDFDVRTYSLSFLKLFIFSLNNIFFFISFHISIVHAWVEKLFNLKEQPTYAI